MTQKTKLEIIGPYTPEHEGPFCTQDGRRARIICLDRAGDLPIIALVKDGEQERSCAFNARGKYCLSDRGYDLMNAREVPVAREFFVNEYSWGYGGLYGTQGGTQPGRVDSGFVRTVHLREVLPGEGV